MNGESAIEDSEPSAKKFKHQDHMYFSEKVSEDLVSHSPKKLDLNCEEVVGEASINDDKDEEGVCADEVNDDTDIQSNVFIENSSEDTQKVLLDTIAALEKKVNELSSENHDMKAKISGLEKLFNEDQIDRLLCPGSRKPYLTKTLQEGIHLYYTCGTSAYNFLRDKGFPYPSVRTLQRHLVGIDCQPGIQHDFINLMKKRTDNLSREEKFCGLSIDEMSISPKIEYDPTTQSYIGFPTIPPSKKLVTERMHERNAKEFLGMEVDDDDDQYAYHALNVLLCGHTVRYKQIVGYHFTDNSFDAEVFAQWLRELIKEIKDTLGLVINSITTDMGPTNQAV